MGKKTALYEEHVRLNGRMVDFGGWDLPIQYTGVMDEHQACRHHVGLFDVSHMGEVHVEGAGAEAFLNYLVTNDVSKCAIGQAHYTVMCNEQGGIVDDLIIYRRSADRFLLVINAANSDKDYAWMERVHADTKDRFGKLTLSNESSSYSQIAVQGREAEKLTQLLTDVPLSEIKYYRFTEGNLLGKIPALIARTGYTGEDGFELYTPWNAGPEVWQALLENGKPFGVKPCGLGARDTLRMEMKFPLYGHELTDETNPLEAGLAWIIKLAKGDFVGRAPIEKMKEEGIPRKLVGLKLLERGIARQGYKLFEATDPGIEIGEVTSGTQSPSLGEAIAIAYVNSRFAEIGTKVSVDLRGRKLSAEVVKTPFYQRPY